MNYCDYERIIRFFLRLSTGKCHQIDIGVSGRFCGFKGVFIESSMKEEIACIWPNILVRCVEEILRKCFERGCVSAKTARELHQKLYVHTD